MRKVTKRFIAAFIAVLFCFSHHAQTTDTGHTKIDLSDFGLSIKTRAYDTYSESEKKLFVAFVDSVALDILTIDDKLERTTDSISYKFPAAGYTIQKAEVNRTSINYLIKNQTQSLRLLEYDRKRKKWTMGDNLFINGEKYLCSFSHKGSFLIFNFSKKNNQVKVYLAGMKGPESFKDFDLRDFKLGENGLDHFLGKDKKGIKVINHDSPNELFASISKTKAYHHDEHVYLTIEDTLSCGIGVIEFNLNTKKHSVNYFNSGSGICEGNEFVKSALSSGHFAMIKGDLAHAKISIWDLNSKMLLGKMYLYPDSLIKFKNADNLISPKQALSIEKLKSRVLLQKFVAGTGAIYLKENEKYMELVVGFSNVKNKSQKHRNRDNNSRKGRGAGTGGGKQKKLDRAEARKIKALGLSKSYLNYEASRTSCFVSLLDLNTGIFDPSASYSNAFEYIKSFKSSLDRRTIGTQVVFDLNGYTWYGYLNRVDQSLHLQKYRLILSSNKQKPLKQKPR